MLLDNDKLTAKEIEMKKRKLELQEKMRKDAVQNEKWLLQRAKPCPQCTKWIEKNQGCNHMTCQPQAGGCGHQFCWLCLGYWQGHSNCNMRNVAQKQQEILERRRKDGYWDGLNLRAFSSDEEERLAHYSTRFLEAMKSRDHLKSLREAIHTVVQQSATTVFTRSDSDSLSAAI